jgi:hypothetical protein
VPSARLELRACNAGAALDAAASAMACARASLLVSAACS